MSKIAILSDIHSNSDALLAVLKRCEQLDTNLFASLGDIVGYNAEPTKCINLVKNLNFVGRVRGNHDEYAADSQNAIEGFNENARIAVEWTANHLSEEDKAWLLEAKYKLPIIKYKMTLVHATLDTPENWGYILREYDARINFNYQRITQICFCGHSHMPIAYEKNKFGINSGDVKEITSWCDISDNPSQDFSHEDSVSIKLEYEKNYLFNIGSIGQPRNRDPRASFVIYDTDKNIVTRYCIPYDIESAQAKIIAAGLPNRLAERLKLGR